MGDIYFGHVLRNRAPVRLSGRHAGEHVLADALTPSTVCDADGVTRAIGATNSSLQEHRR